MSVTLPPKGRDLRLDLFRGIANWAIFLDHIPDNIVNWITTRNYGFSDAADLFVFISGYTACFVYARMMLERGFITGGTRLIKRVWQIYVAHVLLLVVYLAEIGYLAQKSRALSVRPFRDRRVPRGALCAAQLGRLRTASLPAGDRMRATVARGFLRRNFLSFGAHFVLVEVSHATPMQIAVSITGIMLMTVVAFYRSWSKRMDKSPPKPTSQLPVDFQVARAG